MKMATKRALQPAECLEFTWLRRVKGPGFQWMLGQQGKEILVGPPDEFLLTYQPLKEETGLFFIFGHLDGGKEGFRRFADTYGRLGTYHTLVPELGEPLYEWERYHRWMQFLVELRDECDKDQPSLGQKVSWERDEVIFNFPKVDSSVETWRQRGYLRQRLLNSQGLPLFKPGDRVGPARWFLAYALDQWLRELDGIGKPIATRMIWSEEERRARLVFCPSNLLGAMVYQFAAAVNGSWPFRECAYCHKFFRLAPGVNRRNRLTCSTTCKQYLHNDKVKRAHQLHDAGKSLRQIAEQLKVVPHGRKSSTDIVRGWLARA